MIKIVKTTVIGLSWLLLILAGLVVVVTRFPIPGLYGVYTILSGSMEPTLSVGSLIVTQAPKDEKEIPVGSIITFTLPGEDKKLITHRVVDIEKNGSTPFFITKGDANPSADNWHIPYGRIKGVAKQVVPYLGTVVEFMHSLYGIILFALVPLALLIIQELKTLIDVLVDIRLAKRTQGRVLKVVQLGLLLLAMLLPVAINETYAVFSSSTVTLANNNLTTAVSFQADHLVINEVYFFVDPAKGQDCFSSSSGRGRNISATNKNTGPNSNNTIDIDVSDTTNISKENIDAVQNDIDIDVSTGDNNANNNAGNGSARSGDVDLRIDIRNNMNSGGTRGQCDEWVELYNPTNQDISLKNWQIVDDSGVTRTIQANKTIKAGGFALLVKSHRTFSLFWSVPAEVPIIELGQPIGNGLHNTDDRLKITNPAGVEIDSISWGTDMTPPHYAGPITIGHSIERVSPGLDTNNGTDFQDQITPSLGQ